MNLLERTYVRTTVAIFVERGAREKEHAVQKHASSLLRVQHNISTMPSVWTFEIKGEDCRVQIAESGTLFELMQIICDSWLDEARDGDGGIYDHLWKIVRHGSQHVGPFNNEGWMDDDDVIAETAERSTKICDLKNLAVGAE